jgi:hypothetical protein
MSDVRLEINPAIVVETPSEAIVKDANRVVIVTDERGRKLSVKRMDNGLASFRIARVLGNDSSNGMLFAQAMLYVSCVAINDDPVPFPKTELQLEALIDRLDLDGLKAIQKVQAEEFGVGADQDEAVAEAKN